MKEIADENHRGTLFSGVRARPICRSRRNARVRCSTSIPSSARVVRAARAADGVLKATYVEIVTDEGLDRDLRADLPGDHRDDPRPPRAVPDRPGSAGRRTPLGRPVSAGPPRAQGLSDGGDQRGRLRPLGSARQDHGPADLPPARRADARAGRLLRLDARPLARSRPDPRAGAADGEQRLQGAEVVLPLRPRRWAGGDGEERRDGADRPRGGRPDGRNHARRLHGLGHDLHDSDVAADRGVPAALDGGAGAAGPGQRLRADPPQHARFRSRPASTNTPAGDS